MYNVHRSPRRPDYPRHLPPPSSLPLPRGIPNSRFGGLIRALARAGRPAGRPSSCARARALRGPFQLFHEPANLHNGTRSRFRASLFIDADRLKHARARARWRTDRPFSADDQLSAGWFSQFSEFPGPS
jgi:hypothetical protein